MRPARSMLFSLMMCVPLFGFMLSTAALAATRDVQFVVYSSEDRVPLYQQSFDAFQAKTGISVQHQPSPAAQVQKWEMVITRIAGGVSPDVVGAVSVEFVQYAANGLIMPVDDLMKRDKVDTGHVIPILVSAHQWRGRQYMMPYGASGLPLVYNVQLFDEAGVTHPPDVWDQPEWTWETFVESLKKLTKKDADGNIIQYGLATAPMDSWVTLPYTWGGDWIDDELKRFMGTSPETLSSLQALQDMRWTYEVMGTSGNLLFQGSCRRSRYGHLESSHYNRQSFEPAHSPVVQSGHTSPQGSHQSHGSYYLGNQFEQRSRLGVCEVRHPGSRRKLPICQCRRCPPRNFAGISTLARVSPNSKARVESVCLRATGGRTR